MFRRLFHSPNDGDNASKNGSQHSGTAKLAVAVAELSCECSITRGEIAAGTSVSFEQIYQNAASKPTRMNYGILKIVEMLNSPHLAGMSLESKRNSLLMALDTAGVEIEDVLQDAVVRQRALNDYEETQLTWLKGFEAGKLEENRRIQAELEKITSQYMSRIQANMDELAHAQDDLHNWQKAKQREAQRITEAATYCVPQGSTGSNGTLAAVLERASVGRK